MVLETKSLTCKENRSQARSYGRGDGRADAQEGVKHTDLEGRFNADVTGMRYFDSLGKSNWRVGIS